MRHTCTRCNKPCEPVLVESETSLPYGDRRVFLGTTVLESRCCGADVADDDERPSSAPTDEELEALWEWLDEPMGGAA